MLSPKTALPVLMIVTAGCVPTQQAVFVNWDTVYRSQPLAEAVPIQMPPPSKPIPGSSATLPGRPAEHIDLRSNKERAERVKAILQLSREETERDLTARLRAAYYRRIKRLEAEKLAELGPEHWEEISAAYGRIRAIFEAYADRRGPLVARLALLAGFPDQDPDSKREPQNAVKIVRERFAEAKDLRKRIAALDSEYRGKVDTVVAEPELSYADKLTKLKVLIEEERAKADKEAMDEARLQVQQEEQDLRTELDKTTTLELPAEPAQSVSIEGGSSSLHAPDVPTRPKEEVLAEIRHALENDVALWVAHNGYRLVADRNSGRDATEEFLTWRRKLHAGP